MMTRALPASRSFALMRGARHDRVRRRQGAEGDRPRQPPAGASMWVEPHRPGERAICSTVRGASEHAPDPKGVYTLVERKHTGVNLGMTVKDEQGREWSVKQPFPGGLDSEAPVEVVAVATAVRGRLSPAAGLLPAGLHAERRPRQARRSRRPLPV